MPGQLSSWRWPCVTSKLGRNCWCPPQRRSTSQVEIHSKVFNYGDFFMLLRLMLLILSPLVWTFVTAFFLSQSERFKSQVPAYISDLFISYNPSQNLRFSGGGLLSIPASWVKTKRDGAFSNRAPRLWNDLFSCCTLNLCA